MSINTDWDGLKRMAKEFADVVATLNQDELQNGFKCLGLAYLNCTFPEGERGRILREVEAPALLRIMGRMFIKREQELDDLAVINMLRTIDLEMEAV